MWIAYQGTSNENGDCLYVDFSIDRVSEYYLYIIRWATKTEDKLAVAVNPRKDSSPNKKNLYSRKKVAMKNLKTKWHRSANAALKPD